MDPVLDMLCRQIATILARRGSANHSPTEDLPNVSSRIADHLRAIHEANSSASLLTPELLDWARGQFTEEQAVAGLREIRETGGLSFDDVIRGLEPGRE